MKIRDLLGSLSIRLDEALGKLIMQASDIAVVAASVERLNGKVEAIQPVRVDLTQELADDIVAKIHGPLTIPQHFSDWIKEQAKFRDIQRIDPLGYGPMPGTIMYILKADGTMYLNIRDPQGADLWQGTFIPPGFAGRP